MLKKLIVCVFSLIPGISFAAGYGDAGCGLGSLVFGSEAGFVQIFAATTNGSSGNQTFGITTGTLNCQGMAKEADEFININNASLQLDAAKGDGETLVSLGQIFRCEDHKAFNHIIKANYGEIFEDNNPKEIRRKIMAVLTLGDINCHLES